jgi:hypothetical protein
MSSSTIVNAAPMTIFQGIQDLSTRPVAVVPEVLPTHLPKVYLYTKQGPTDPQLVVGSSLTNMYDVNSFDLTQKWATHATVLANTINAQGNSLMVERLEPLDAAPPANVRVYMDILPATIPNYTRNSDGSIAVDSSGNKIASGTGIAGYQVKFVAVQIPVTITSNNSNETITGEFKSLGAWDANANNPVLTSTGTAGTYYTVTTAGNTAIAGVAASVVPGSYGWNVGDIIVFDSTGAGSQITDATVTTNFGQATQTAGDQTVGLVQSIRYPFFDAVISNFGEYGNNQGLVLWAPTTNSSPSIDPSLLDQFVYPLRMACVSRADSLSTSTVTPTLDAMQYVDCCLKPNTRLSTTTQQMYIGDVFINAYQSILDPSSPPQYGPFGQFKLYDAEILTCLNMFYAAEQPYISTNAFTDFTGVANEQYRFNILGGASSAGVPYFSYQVVTGASNSTVFTQNSNLYACGGDDGTMNEELFATLVATAISEYADPNSVLQDIARYPESIFYDSGFPIATKKAITSFIAIRKDTAIVLSTHDVLLPQLTAAQESSLALALLSYCQMYPESDYYGTNTVRAMIIGRSGTFLNSLYSKPLPLTIEIAYKAAQYMGAGNGIWKPGFSFDMAPLSQVQLFINVNVTFTPATVRNTDWSNGLNWVESFQRRTLYFPALKTVYANDTAVLTSFFTMMACVELEKVGDRCRRQFSGESSLTDTQLIERVNQFVIDATTGRFDGRFTIIPRAYISASDSQRGYSWTLPIDIYAPNMKTVMTLSIVSYRISDLTTS